MLPYSIENSKYQLNASSFYYTMITKNAFDGSPTTHWESDKYLYTSPNGYFNTQANCTGYCSALNMPTLDYPAFSQLVETHGEWIQVKFNYPTGIAGYAITAQSGSFTPSSWKLLVSYPEQLGSTWYAIHIVENENRWDTAVNRTIYYDVPQEIVGYPLPIYRLVITKTNGVPYVQISEFSLHLKNQTGRTFIYFSSLRNLICRAIHFDEYRHHFDYYQHHFDEY